MRIIPYLVCKALSHTHSRSTFAGFFFWCVSTLPLIPPFILASFSGSNGFTGSPPSRKRSEQHKLRGSSDRWRNNGRTYMRCLLEEANRNRTLTLTAFMATFKMSFKFLSSWLLWVHVVISKIQHKDFSVFIFLLNTLRFTFLRKCWWLFSLFLCNDVGKKHLILNSCGGRDTKTGKTTEGHYATKTSTLSKSRIFSANTHTHTITGAKVLVVPTPPFIASGSYWESGSTLQYHEERERARHTLANKPSDNSHLSLEFPTIPCRNAETRSAQRPEDEPPWSCVEPGSCYAFPHSTCKCTWVDD